MKKLLVIFGFVFIAFISNSNLYACGGGGGEGSGENPDSDMFGDLILGTLKMSNFEPVSQDYIAGDTLDIGYKSEVDMLRGEAEKADLKVKILEGVVLGSGLALGALAGPAGLSAGGAIVVGAAYSGATSATQDIQEKSLKETAANAMKAAIQSGILGGVLPNNPIVGGVIDYGLSKVPNSTKGPSHMDGLVDYGPGHVDLPNGTRVMK